MYYFTNETCLFGLTTSLILVVILLELYTKQTLGNIRRNATNPAIVNQYCAFLNILFPVKVAVKGLSSLFLLWQGRWALFVLDMIKLAFRLCELLICEWRVYDPTIIVDRNEPILMFMFFNYLTLMHLVIGLFRFMNRTHQEVDVVNWSKVGMTRHGKEMMHHFPVIFITFCMLAILLYYSLKYSQLEVLDPYSPEASDLRVELNELLPVKFLIHAVLTSTIFAFGYWKLFCFHLCVLIPGIVEIEEAKLNRLGFYNPEDMAASLDKLNGLKKTCLCRLHLFFAFLYVFSYAMLYKLIDKPLMLWATEYKTAKAVTMVNMLLSSIFIVILALIRANPNVGVNINRICYYLNALYTINTLIHLHFYVSLLVQGGFHLVCVAHLLVFLYEIKDIFSASQRDKTFRFNQPADLFDSPQLITRHVNVTFLHGLLLIIHALL